MRAADSERTHSNSLSALAGRLLMVMNHVSLPRAMLTALREHAHAKPWAWHALPSINARVTVP
jgi:hypothetical protein